MNIFKKLFKYTFFLLGGIILYALMSIIISFITVNKKPYTAQDSETLYIHTNGVHLSIILPVTSVSTSLKEGLNISNNNYAKFGWGDKGFYLNVPTWDDFELKYALGAFFLDNPTFVQQDLYKNNEDFYEAKGSYSPIKTCNTWVNNGLKQSGIKASYWTLLDYGLLHKYKK